MADLLVGGGVDAASHQRSDHLVTLPSGDLTTHGVIVGMTGSGKTGLGVVLVESALAAGVPVLLIDPKGDLTNLCLTFPALAPADFEPWVNPGDAQSAGKSVADFAADQAALWTKGLGDWGMSGATIGALRDTAALTIYTPGSSGGVGLNIVGSLTAPADTSDAETVRKCFGALRSLMELRGMDMNWGRSLYGRLIATGLVNVEADAHFEFRRGGSPGARLDQANLFQVRDQLLGERLLTSEELDRLLRRLDDPDFVVAAPAMFRARGQQPRA
jgi:hypothetical protein